MVDAVSVTDLLYAYDPGHPVLDAVSFTVAPGERVGFVGANGAGKTTLFMLLCGILEPGSGTLRVFGEPVRHRRFNPALGYVFQNPDNQLFSPTVYDDVAFGPVNMDMPAAEADAAVHRALEECGVGGVADRPSHHLSGGEKRMVAVASVLAMRPRAVIYDEPTASLDMRARRDVISLINGNPERTSLVSSHDLEFIREVCGRVIVLADGAVIADGGADEVLGNAALMERAGQEVPHSLRE